MNWGDPNSWNKMSWIAPRDKFAGNICFGDKCTLVGGCAEDLCNSQVLITELAKSTTMSVVDSPSKFSRRFDGWSFFGGIILTVGIAGISFAGYKYYQSRGPKPENYNLM